MVGPTHRRFHRRIVEWPASCDLAGESVTGRVLDYSWGGAFFCPDYPSTVNRGERIALAIESSQGNRQLEFVAKVVWTGNSKTHACRGFGLEFIPPSPSCSTP